MRPAIEVRGLEKSYGDVKALRGVTFSVNFGEIIGYLGPNGAGKSTTIKIIAGILKPDVGDVLIDGISVLDDPIEAKEKLSYVPEEGGLFEHLTVMEHIQLIVGLRELGESGMVKGLELLGKFGLMDKLHHRISTLSKGSKQKLLIAGAFMVDADVYLLDEPLVGIDAPTALLIKEMLRELARNDKAILFSSHILETVERLCDKVIIIDHGEIIATGDMESIKTLGTLEDFFSRLINQSAS